MKKFHAALIVLALLLAAVPVLLAHPDDDGSADTVRAAPSPGLQGGKAAARGDKGKDDKDETKKDQWDVNNPPGPSTTATIDVREGTWMSVDVSPDGQEIVFDLLGDLYTIPFAGGEAKALTQDVAWQEQPRYSPDGKTISFSSDQGGGDNLWLIDRDGKNPRQVTKETFRLVNSPAWTPDGESLVVRKHFTARRSAGAGEMWLYHRSGGDGLQMTKRPNDQKDAGEPAFSPDGRYLYYSQDTTPGATFEYNKDVNGQIYVIQRLDRETGETAAIVTGPGGAIRPTPSPDGKTLAFIRRVRGKSVIHLQNLRSGEAWPLYDGLDRDLQETWAVHGVYPGMAWTADSRALVFWAGGKIHRLDVASRQVTEIPFHVKSTRKISQALRFPVQVAPERFEVKMLRQVEVAPAGDKVVYQALGYLWIRDLPTGTPRRLTSQNDHFEVYPSFSRDGRSIVYATWDDEKLGSVRVMAADGSGERTLTREPGHYVEPVFSPDGQWVVYRKTDGGTLRAPVWTSELGLYKVPAAGGEAWRVSRHGASPHFGARSDRLYFQDGAGDSGGVSLFVVNLDARGEREEHEVLSSKRATQYRLSPDGRFVAFREGYNSYIAPFLPTGQSAEIGPKAKSIPVVKVSRDEGDNLRWSGDGKRLYWTLGPELFSRDLPDAFAFLAGAPQKLPETPVRGQAIGFSAAADVPPSKVAVVGGRVVPMNGTQVIEDGVVLIEGNRIKAVGKRGEVAVPADAHVIDAAGKTVLPGFIDVHWHGNFGDDGLIPEESWINAASLAFGVTTLHDPSNDTETVFATSELGKAGMITAPRIFSTGTILYGADAPFTVEIESLEDARASLRRLKAVGAFSVKSYNQPRREQRQEVIAAARELGMMVVPEGGSLFPYNMTMIVDGHTGVEHALPIARLYEDVKQLWSASKTGYTPTLGVAYGGIFGENYWYDKTDVWADERLAAFVPREVLDPRSRRRTKAPDEEYNHIQAAKGAKELLDRGVSIQLGAHGQREGLAAHWEMWMMAQGGMTPFEILRAATLDGARYLGLDGDIGSLATGKLADVIILDKNPLEDIRNSESVHWVIANGRVLDAATLNEVYPRQRKREPFFWERQKPAFSGE